MIWFNSAHNGLTLEAEGDVTLTAANPQLADPKSPSFPAVVNHVVYFGDGVSQKTVFRGFKIRGANGFVTRNNPSNPIEPATDLVFRGFKIRGANGFVTRNNPSNPIEPATDLEKGLFYLVDGGAIKIFGRSYPTLSNLDIRENVTQLCAGAISIEHQGHTQSSVTIRDCVFIKNRCPVTGPAIAMEEGSSATIENCLFVGNIGNYGMDEVYNKWGLSYKPEHGCGAVTVFPKSHAVVTNCTFTKNWNGVDDSGQRNVYRDCIFWRNDASDGSRPSGPYEIDISDASNVQNCFFGGEVVDLQSTLDAETNQLATPDPQFDENYVPRSSEYAGIGYRSPK
jgi:hypothetical protein